MKLSDRVEVLTLERFLIGAAAFLLVPARRPAFRRPSAADLGRASRGRQWFRRITSSFM